MVILWDKTYFERIWCVFEIGAYIALYPKSPPIKLVPIQLYQVELIIMVAASWCMVSTSAISIGSNMASTFMRNSPELEPAVLTDVMNASAFFPMCLMFYTP